MLTLLPVIVIAMAVLASSSLQRSAEQRGFDRVQHSQQLLAAWLDRANPLRVFLQTGSPTALGTFDRSMRPFESAVQTERTDVHAVPGAPGIFASEVGFAQRWQGWALAGVAQIRRHGVRPLPLALTRPRANAAVAFQTANERLTGVMEKQRTRDIADVAKVGDGIVVLAFLIVALAALAAVRARRNRDTRAMEARLREEHDRAGDERAYVEGRRRLSQVLLAAETSEEAVRP